MRKICISLAFVSLATAACSSTAEPFDTDILVQGTTTAAVKKPVMEPKPTTGGGGGGSGSSSTCGHDADQCFGAVGLSCDGVLVLPGGTIAGCNGDQCVINAGSWDHDECCFTNPNGHFCGVQNAASGPTCTTQWDKAVHRVTHGLSWRRTLDRCRHDTDGRVDFAEYCAFDGTIVASNDTAKCCSQRARPYDAQRDAFMAGHQGLWLDGSFTPVVCEAAPAPPTGAKQCLSNAQCQADERCMSRPGTTVKFCVKV